MTLPDVNAALVTNDGLAPKWYRSVLWEMEWTPTTQATAPVTPQADPCAATRDMPNPPGEHLDVRAFQRMDSDENHGIIFMTELLASDEEAGQALAHYKARVARCPEEGFRATSMAPVGDDRFSSRGRPQPAADGSRTPVTLRMVRVGRILIVQRAIGEAPDQTALADALLERQVELFEAVLGRKPMPVGRPTWAA